MFSLMPRIRVIGSMEPKICTKMHRNLNEKLEAEFPASTLASYSMVKVAHLNDAFSEIFELEASPVDGQL